MSDRLSLLVSHVLDRMGYSEEMRQYRINSSGEENYLESLCSRRTVFQLLLAGSKAEGASKWHESDFDYLRIYGGVNATECEDIIEGDNVLTLYMESVTAPPGYCKLQLLHCGRDNFHHHETFLRDECYVVCPGYCRPHLSSTFVLYSEHQYMPHHTEICGPSNKGQRQGHRETDNVYAIRCSIMPNSLKTWIRKRTQHNRPTRKIIEQIARSNVYLVPAGKHGSDQQFLEWRLSFNTAEKILIHNFTTIQYKVYILLKMFTKEVIQPQCPESVTSYIVKTLMLWAVEQLSSAVWRTENLVHLFSVLLKGLCSSIQNGHCSMYFIPDDNILQGRLKEETQKYIFTKLAAILSDHDPCVLTIPSIARQIYQYTYLPLPLRVYSQDEQEKAEITLNLVRLIHSKSLKNIYRHLLICCIEKNAAIPYNGLLRDLVFVGSPPIAEWKETVKYPLGQVLSALALQECIDATGQMQNNIQTYTTFRRCTKLMNIKRDTQSLCGRVDLAQVLYILGQYKAALNVLADAAETIRYYTWKMSCRSSIQRRKPNYRLIKPIGNDCLSTKKLLKHFTMQDQQYDHDMESYLQKPFRYEIYKSFDSVKERVLYDSEILLYYLNYLCYEQLGQRRCAHVAFSKLIWCATSRDSNIEYREVALNILGHCLMEKGLYRQAARVLVKSFMLTLFLQRKFPGEAVTNKTGAVWHIAILLHKIGIS